MHNEPDNEKHSTQGSGVQPPDGSTEAFVRDLLWNEHPECCGCPDVGAEYMGAKEMICCGNPEPSTLSDAQIVASLRARFREAVCAEPAPATAGASENSGTDEPKQGDHLSEQPSVDRCVLTDEQIDALDTFALYVMAPRERESVRAFARAVIAAVNQQASEPDEPKVCHWSECPHGAECVHAVSKGSGVREALARLVALNDLKYRIENWDTDSGRRSEVLAMMDEYEREKPLAWEAARSALALHSGEEI